MKYMIEVVSLAEIEAIDLEAAKAVAEEQAEILAKSINIDNLLFHSTNVRTITKVGE